MDALKIGMQIVFSSKKYFLLFIFLSLLFVPIYAIITNVFVLPSFKLNPHVRLLEAFLVFIISILASLGFTIAAFQIFELRATSKKSIGGGIIGASAGGTVLASFGSACGVCQPVWLIWLGFGSFPLFLLEYSTHILAISIALLLFSIYSGLKTISNCPLGKKTR